MVVERNDVCLKLKVRRAVEEDNDDIVPIIDRQSEKLRQLYGDYYVSELISRHPDSERVLLVCEHKEVAVGVMCLNTQINYEELEESFDLTPFAGLKRLEKITPPTPVGLEESSSSILLDDKTEEPEKEHSQISVSKSIKSRVTWGFEKEEFQKVTEKQPKTPQSKYSFDVLNLLDDEVDEFDYEIVNIPPELMVVPKFLLGCQEEEQKKAKRKESFYDNKYLDKDIGKRSSLFPVITEPAKPPQPACYIGQPNAFILELFAMHQDYDESWYHHTVSECDSSMKLFLWLT
ncbi:cilia- and flagella-associated protein 61-like [Leptidea sinapis]|uniref:cilia- and flagella-associated protein 61-like n=1 Tax=Leptidea sinapis TaxID=189913 RepID=UPI0021C30CA2|nr:cilia- and flagella-associated protein 61-like [Leptidea sinapis]